MVLVLFWDGLEIVTWFGDGLGVVGGRLEVVWGLFGPSLGERRVGNGTVKSG